MKTLTEPHITSNTIEAMVGATRRLGIDKLLGATAIEFFADVTEKGAAADTGNFEAGGFMVEKWKQEELYCPIVTTQDRSNRNIVATHFAPTIFLDGRKSHEIYKPHDGQKNQVILQGMYGALAYITVVEAGLKPRPTALVGETNQTMAKFAKRFGFMSIEDYVHSSEVRSPIRTPVDVGPKNLQQIIKDYFDLARLNRQSDNPYEVESQQNEHISHVLKALYEQGHRATANAILGLVVLSVNNEAVPIFCDYETFKLKTLAFAHKFHKVLTNGAIREIRPAPQ